MEDILDLIHLEFIIADQFDIFVFLIESDLAFTPPEIKTLTYFFHGLVNGVIQFRFVYFGHHIE